MSAFGDREHTEGFLPVGLGFAIYTANYYAEHYRIRRGATLYRPPFEVVAARAPLGRT